MVRSTGSLRLRRQSFVKLPDFPARHGPHAQQERRKIIAVACEGRRARRRVVEAIRARRSRRLADIHKQLLVFEACRYRVLAEDLRVGRADVAILAREDERVFIAGTADGRRVAERDRRDLLEEHLIRQRLRKAERRDVEVILSRVAGLKLVMTRE